MKLQFLFKFLASCAALVLVLTTLPAQAILMLEPYVSYETARLEDTSTTYSYSNPAFGGRLGISLPVISFGAEAFHFDAYPSVSPDVPGYSFAYSATYLGGFVGVKVPLLGLRVLGTYFLPGDSKLTTTDSSGKKVADVSLKGGGYKVGLWFPLVPFVSIGLEYLNTNNSETRNNLPTPSPYVTLQPNLNNQAAIASVSIPLSI